MFVKIDPNTLLTPQDAADMLGVSTSTLARWRQQGGELKFARLSRQTADSDEGAHLFRTIDAHAFR
jgi:hypothetical protein